MEAAKPMGRARKKRVATAKNAMDLTFFVLVLLLVAVGLIMLFSASYPYAYYNEGDSFYYITRQLFFAMVGITLMLIISRIDYHILHRFAYITFMGSVLLLIIVLFYHTDPAFKRWIPLGFATFQPSELAKFALVLIFAHLISINYEKMRDPKYGIFPFLSILAVVAILMVLEPHLSGTILILCIGIIMMFVGGTDIKWFVLSGVALVCAIIVVVLIPGAISYASSRFAYWIDPFSDATGLGYQTIQSLYAIGSGGLMGVGIGNSRQKHLYLPEPHNDFIFSVVCEELGFIGAVLIILLFVLLIWRGFVIAMRCRDRFGSMITVGLITQVGIQTILNIAVVSNTIPNTGISLPFFSYGGTALVMLLSQMGIILSVSRHSAMEKE